MTKFKINEEVEVVCEWKKTRNGFKHEATLLRDGRSVQTVKVCYLNRTWEAFEFDTVLKKLAEKSGIKEISEFVKNRTNDSGTDFLKSVGMVAKLGELFASTTKDKNDWKVRMLKAGLENKGLSLPEDWESLTEEEKEKRLDGAICQLT
jgi:hypothetical protein